MSIEDNVAAHKAADDVWTLSMSEAAAFRGEAALRFWERLARKVFETLPEERRPRQIIKADIVPMMPEEVQAFERREMEFGQYIGTDVGNVPLDYLVWLDCQSDFRRELRRYLASDQIQRTMEDGRDE